MAILDRSLHPLSVLALLLAASLGAQAAPAYVAREVLGPGGQQGLQAHEMNDAGAVCGETPDWQNADAFLARAGGGYSSFDAFGADFTTAWGLNRQGDVVGYARTPDRDRAFLKPRGKAPIPLFEAGLGDVSSYAFSVNATDQVVGNYITPDGVVHAFSWTAGVVTKLPSLGGARTQAIAVNDAGVVVGLSHRPKMKGSHAVKWVDGVLVDLGGFGYADVYGDAPFAINAAGHIVGYCNTAGAIPRGCVWHDGAIDKLSSLDGTWSIAYAIDDHDVIVGSSSWPASTGRAVIWKHGVITDLNDLVDLPAGTVLEQASAIDAHGRILVRAYGDGAERYYVLMPVGQQLE